MTPGRVHARVDRPCDAPRAKARLRFRLTCVTRIFQKSVFTKFAHGRRACGLGERFDVRARQEETAPRGSADLGLQLQPKVEGEDNRRPRATKPQADLSSSSRSAATGMTRHIPYRTERELAFLR